MVWSWLWGISWLGWVVFWVLSNTFIFDIGNISTIGISHIVGDNLGATIGKVYTVFTISSITVTVFVGSKISFSIVIMDCISVLVHCWSFFIDWSLAISWSWGMVSWGMYYWLVDNWYNWGNVWSYLVYYWCNIWGRLVNWGWLINWCRFVYWCWVVWGWLVNWNMSRSMNGSTVFFSSIWIVYVLWSSMGLARYGGMVSTMGLMDSNFYCRSISMLNNLMTALVSQSYSQKNRYCDECLKEKVKDINFINLYII